MSDKEYIEGSVEASVRKILQQKFGMEYTSQVTSKLKDNEELEFDSFGYSNDEKNEAIIVEIESSFDEESLAQILETLRKFPDFFPEHADKKLYGLVAAVHIPNNLRQRVLKEGLHLAIISDDIFKMAEPKDFKARQFNPLIKDNGGSKNGRKKRK